VPKITYSWEEAIRIVLSEAGSAMHVSDMAEQIAARGLRKVGANPNASISAILSLAIQSPASQFQRVGRGEYILKETLETREDQKAGAEADEQEEALQTGALKAFGMFWQRDLVMWSGRRRLLGRQSLGASDVNFAEQVGVYLLHDRDRVIYVGRAADTLFTRLQAHTVDRLSGRWDRFSWFGLRSVDSEGQLSEPSVAWTHSVVIETLEALLIESLEPPLNRKRGDNFSGAEYLQVSDPEIEGLKKKQLIAELVRSAGLSS
jgi:hypothetical protein